MFDVMQITERQQAKGTHHEAMTSALTGVFGLTPPRPAPAPLRSLLNTDVAGRKLKSPSVPPRGFRLTNASPIAGGCGRDLLG